jgi:hypothetical protein
MIMMWNLNIVFFNDVVSDLNTVVIRTSAGAIHGASTLEGGAGEGA